MSETDNQNVFGTKTSQGRLHGGFFLLGAGGLLGLVSLIFFFIALGANEPGNASTDPYYDFMKVTLTSAPIALACLMMGFSFALPTKTGLRMLSWAGFAFCAISSLLFLLHYPTQFNVAGKVAAGTEVTDWMPYDVGIFVLGFVFIGAAMISSVVGFYLSKTTVVKGEAAEDEDIYGAGYEVPDWVVEKDIEYAMKKYGVQWGEGGKDNESNTIVVNVADSFAGATIGGLGKARTVQLDAEQVDLGVQQLTKTRPQKGGALPSEWADDATRALVAFRKQKEANPKAFKPKRSFWQKVGDFFTGRSTTPQAAPARVTPKVSATVRANGSSAPAKRGKTIVIEDEK